MSDFFQTSALLCLTGVPPTTARAVSAALAEIKLPAAAAARGGNPPALLPYFSPRFEGFSQ